MMLGMLKDIGSKVLNDQARTCRRRGRSMDFLPQDVRDHLSLEERRERDRTAKRDVSAPSSAVLV